MINDLRKKTNELNFHSHSTFESHCILRTPTWDSNVLIKHTSQTAPPGNGYALTRY